MKTLRILYHVALADFYERARRYRFLVTLAAIIILGVLVNTGTALLDVGTGGVPPYSPRYRGELNSPYIGTMTVLVSNTFLVLFGFYLVSDCIERDTRTGVGQIIATTPVSRAVYLVGKWLSNFVVLSVLVLILGIAALVMVLIQGEAAMDLGALLLPFFAVGLPLMALIAALAVVFETVPWFRGAVGNVVYFILCITICGSSISWDKDLGLLNDPLGINVFRQSLYEGARAAFPNELIGGMGVGLDPAHDIQYKIFNWQGLDWTPSALGGQWFWAAFGLGLVLLSALWFARFDPSREKQRRARVKPNENKEEEPVTSQERSHHSVLAKLWQPVSRLTSRLDISPLISKLAQMDPFLGVLFAELRMLLKGRRWWWWLVTLSLNIAIFLSPYEITKEYVLAVAFLWLLPVLSVMGNRERKHNTSQMVFSSARPVLRQLPAAWLAGVVVTLMLAAAGGVVFLMHGDMPALAGWVGAVIFVPTLALALGVFSSGSRVFEVIYVIWLYLGPMQKVPGMDFISGPPQFYLLAAAGLMLLTTFWRGRQVRV